MSKSDDRIARLTALGQSLWLDNLSRQLIESGELAELIARGEVRGITSNPTIFNHAIGKSPSYDSALMPLAWAGWDAERIFWQLAVEDIRSACDLFRPLYDRTGGGDGFVSLEVSPRYAHDTAATSAQVHQLWDAVDRKNLMVKIPATEAGIPAIRDCIAAGMNINITLIFSLRRYDEVMEAYVAGLEARARAGQALDHITSVASFFVSRVDTKVDARLPENSPLRGKAGIANAKLAYRRFEDFFGAERFTRLRSDHGARLQRPLWASTSTKNPAYSDTLYADNLIGPETVDTVPPQTLEAFRDHGKPAVTLTQDVDGAARIIAELEASGIHMEAVTQELEDEGVKSFADSFSELLQTIEERRRTQVDQLALLAESVSERMAKLEKISAPARLYQLDASLWTTDPAGQTEIRNRLGWLDLPWSSRPLLQELNDFAREISEAGFTHALLLGMGGSSLAPEVMSLMFGAGDRTTGSLTRGLSLSILDSTDPAQILEAEQRAPLGKTLFIFSSKSGSTAEVNAFFDYFWARTAGDGSQWIAITDPGTSLEKTAREKGFRRVFQADPRVGGRYSALTAFGLVPAALMGIDLSQLLDRAAWMARQCGEQVAPSRNPGLALGALLGQAALEGRDKLTLIADEPFAPFGAWAEQLIAESSGKQGKGIVPVVDEPLADPSAYGEDRLFIYVRSNGSLDDSLAALRAAGHPAVVLPVTQPYDFASECFRWEIAVAFACAVIGVNAFDQPDVQDSKDRTKAKIATFIQSGSLDDAAASWKLDGVSLYSPTPIQADSLQAGLRNFLARAGQGDFIGINAYLPRNSGMMSLLSDLRVKVRDQTRCATTLGFGPRFLHSTGQLHKGGGANGVFLQITMEPQEQLAIPTQGITFGALERAQALGDYEALVARERRILRIHLRDQESLQQLITAFA